MRIKKLLIVGTLALATTGCVSAYTYAATPNDSTESSIDTSKDSAKIKADSESTTEAKENADENTKKDVKSEKNDFKVDMILKKDTFTGKNAQSVDSRRLIAMCQKKNS